MPVCIFLADDEFAECLAHFKSIGLQLRSSLHYYLFPGFSVYGGIEGNLIQPMMIESYQLPTVDPAAFITIPDYKLNFSSIKLKMGVSIYF